MIFFCSDVIKGIQYKNMYSIKNSNVIYSYFFRQHALAKAKAMTEFIGYPDELLVTANLEEYYQKVYI